MRTTSLLLSDGPVLISPEQALDLCPGPYRAGTSFTSALTRPALLFGYDGECDLGHLAGAVVWSVNRAHVLIDGNKRASLILADAFLVANGHHLSGDEARLVVLAAGAAGHPLSPDLLQVHDGGEGVRVNEATVRSLTAGLVSAGTPSEPFARRHSGVLEELARL